MAITDVFLTSEAALKDSGWIDPNVNGQIIQTAMMLTQDDIIKNCIGRRLFESLKEKIANKTIYLEENSDYKLLLDKYIFKAMLFGVLDEIQVPESFKLRNKGNIRTNGEYINNSSHNEVIWTAQHYANKRDYYMLELCKYVHGNRSLFPETLESVPCWERYMGTGTCYTSNFFFKHKRNCR